MSEIEVVITGMGLVTPLGGNVAENWENVLAKKTGVSRSAEGEKAGVPPCLGKIDSLELPEDIPGKLTSQMRFLNRGSLLGFKAAHEAVSESGINLPDIPPERRALYIASGDLTKVGYDFMYPATRDGSGGSWEKMDFQKLNSSVMAKVNPFFLLESIANNLFSFLSAFFGFMGPNTTIASHSPCGGHALELAWRNIRHGYADIAMAVGCGNWITDVPLYEMQELGILSRCRDGERSYKAFDRNRDGFIPGEGGAAILIESAESAERRGATVLARLRGFGNCIERPSGRGLGVPEKVTERSIRLALEDAECAAEDIGFICPHGSGTQKGDRSELKSIAEVLGGARGNTPICAFKPYTSHMAAASDVAEVILGVKAAASGMVPGALNFDRVEDEFLDLNLSSDSRRIEKPCFLSTSYGVLGESSTVVVEAEKTPGVGER